MPVNEKAVQRLLATTPCDESTIRRLLWRPPWFTGRDRHARGREIACYSGGCPNLGQWLIMSDLWPGRNSVACTLHLDPQRENLRRSGWHRDPQVVPFQDPYQRPPRVKTRGPSSCPGIRRR
jgi:hypothetical protein